MRSSRSSAKHAFFSIVSWLLSKKHFYKMVALLNGCIVKGGNSVKDKIISLIRPVLVFRGIRLIGLILFIVTISSAFLLLTSKETEAGWYDENWLYRTAYSIGNTGAADSDKKVKIDIDTATL